MSFVINSVVIKISVLVYIRLHFKYLWKRWPTHLIIYNDINDDLGQGVMIITMPVNDILKGIDDSSLGSRFLICIYSKFQIGPSIVVTLQEKI